jgi:hypothetical protein
MAQVALTYSYVYLGAGGPHERRPVRTLGGPGGFELISQKSGEMKNEQHVWLTYCNLFKLVFNLNLARNVPTPFKLDFKFALLVEG